MSGHYGVIREGLLIVDGCDGRIVGDSFRVSVPSVKFMFIWLEIRAKIANSLSQQLMSDLLLVRIHGPV